MPLRTLVLTLALMLTASGAAAQQDPKQSGPTHLVIQYRCDPRQRAQLRRAMEERGLGQFEEWKANGILAEYHILFSRYVDTNNWDMLALLAFRRFDDVSKWRDVERRSPAGLPADALALTSLVSTYPADLMRQKASPPAPPRPVYLVVPYTYSVSPAAYLQYVDDYVAPQFDGWMREGILTRYQLLVQRYTAARPWDSLIVLEYKDEESFGLRGAANQSRLEGRER